MAITPEERKALKFRGLILTRDDVHFIARVVSPCGVFTTEQFEALSECAKKYGSGQIALTTRLTVEIMGIPYENLENVVAAVEAVGLVTGGTGSVVRPVVACKGSYCVHGLIDTQAFGDRLYHEFYLPYHDVKLPHKFKIGVGGCPNNCIKPAFHDFGIMAQKVPEYDQDSCMACKKCSVIDKCPVKAFSQDEDGTLVLDETKCTNCGKCIGACNFDTIEQKGFGLKISIGGIWGKTQRVGTPVPGLYTEDEVIKLIEKTILIYREQGITGERFGRCVDRIGADNFIAQMLSDDILERKQAILDAKLHLTGGATC